MPIVRCHNGPFAGHIAFVRPDCRRVELYDAHFLATPEPYVLEVDATGEPQLRWARELSVNVTLGALHAVDPGSSSAVPPSP